jgi:hypothetical protein
MLHSVASGCRKARAAYAQFVPFHRGGDPREDTRQIVKIGAPTSSTWRDGSRGFTLRTSVLRMS